MLSGLGPKTGVGVRWGLDWAKNQRLKVRLAAAVSNQADAGKPRKMLVLESGFRSNQAHLLLVCLMVCQNKKAPGRRLFAGWLAERAGFEPAVSFTPRTLSRRVT